MLLYLVSVTTDDMSSFFWFIWLGTLSWWDRLQFWREERFVDQQPAWQYGERQGGQKQSYIGDLGNDDTTQGYLQTKSYFNHAIVVKLCQFFL